MELTHLRYFLTVAEELHFGRAAQRLHICQPPLSQQIKKLEQELGVKLFSRTSRKVELTAAGKSFLEETRLILERVEHSRMSMQRFAQGAYEYLSLGFNEPAINTFLSKAVREFIHVYPETKLALHELETAEQISALSTRRIHLGIMRPMGFDISSFASRLLWKEQYRLALPSGHPLEKQTRVRPESLRREKFVMLPCSVNPFLSNQLRQFFRKHGFEPDVVQEAISKHTTLALVAAGLGVALVPESSVHFAQGGITFRPLTGQLPLVEIYAVWRRDEKTSVIEHFLNIACDCLI